MFKLQITMKLDEITKEVQKGAPSASTSTVTVSSVRLAAMLDRMRPFLKRGKMVVLTGLTPQVYINETIKMM